MVETYGVTAQGHLDGSSILHLAWAPVEGDARPAAGPPAEGPPVDAGSIENAPTEARLAAARAKLLAARDKRGRPLLDDKILAGWNGLALAALAEAGRALPSERYREAAEATGGFLLREFLRPDHRLYHTWKDGRPSGNGFLDDYAFLVEGLLALYQTTFAEEHFVAAWRLTDSMIEHFRRPEGGFYDTSSDHETLITRPRSLQDSPTPSGNSMAATVLLKIAAFTGESRYRELAEETLAPMGALLERAPLAFGQWLSAYQLADTGITEIAVVGRVDHPRTEALLNVCSRTFRPATVVAARPPAESSVISLAGGARAAGRRGGGGVGLCALHLRGSYHRPGRARETAVGAGHPMGSRSGCAGATPPPGPHRVSLHAGVRRRGHRPSRGIPRNWGEVERLALRDPHPMKSMLTSLTSHSGSIFSAMSALMTAANW